MCIAYITLIGGVGSIKKRSLFKVPLYNIISACCFDSVIVENFLQVNGKFFTGLEKITTVVEILYTTLSLHFFFAVQFLLIYFSNLC